MLIHNLKAISSTLSQDNTVQFYTDGSLQRDPNNIVAMGFGWVLVNNEAIEFSASAVLWPSSTKAEILAVLTALMIIPVKA